MTTSSSKAADRRLVVVSGYYGFGNLGDEAILEELVSELKRLTAPENIVVLSAEPQASESWLQVRCVYRNDLLTLFSLLKESRLFISGGGGLFQNTRTVGSILCYGLQILMAKAQGAAVMIYAQGIGPLRGALAENLTKRVFAYADVISVRDPSSKEMLDRWQLPASKTADPVWCLEASRLPEALDEQIKSIAAGKLVAVSLRKSHNFNETHLDALVESLSQAAPENAHLLLLPLQKEQDEQILTEFSQKWQARGLQCTLLDTASLSHPSQWITLFGRCRLVIAMRLHALIMGMKAGVGVVGLVYDPKVLNLLNEFEQPILILTKENPTQTWLSTLKAAFSDTDRLARQAMRKAEGAKKLACQNFNLLDRILRMQSDS